MWIKPFSKARSSDLMRAVSQECSCLGGPVSRELNMLLQDGSYLELINYSFDYTTIELNDAIYARQIQALVSKSETITIVGVDRAKVAVDRFRESEVMCKATNQRWRANVPFEADIEAVLFTASRKIASMLGDVPALADLNLGYGPGASTGVKGADANFSAKLSAPLECSDSLLPTVAALLSELPMLTDSHAFAEFSETYGNPTLNVVDEFSIVNVCVAVGCYTTVPKNALSDRSIIIEPTLNTVLQHGIGGFLKGRLAASGNSIADRSLNRRLAFKAAVDGTLATVDLSMASDTVSREVVARLLPLDWFEFLDSAATRDVSFQGDVIRLEKFSSMGNGYTFELETLIFWALTSSVLIQQRFTPSQLTNCTVFGDDIICPTECMPLLTKVLEACGFRLNMTKSYWSGPFRESCGADFHNGFDLRPFYLKKPLSYAVLYSMHNFFFRNCEVSLASLLRQHLLDDCEHLYGPDGFGDGHLIGSFELRQNRLLRRNHYGGGIFDTYARNPKRSIKKRPGDFLLPAYTIYVGASDDGPYDPSIVRGFSGYARKSIYTLSADVLLRRHVE